MKSIASFLSLLLLLAGASECFGGMRQRFEALLARKEYAGLQLGVCITDDRGTPLFSFHETAGFIPASNQKLLTGACGLLHFGPGHRFRTSFYKKGPLANGVLRGDLVVRGTGAIEFTARYTDDFQRKKEILDRQLDEFSRKLKNAGVRRIEGDIVIDGSAWSGPACNMHYPAAGSVTFNENAVEIEVVGQKIRTAPDPVVHFKLVQKQIPGGQEKLANGGKPTDTILLNIEADSADYWRIDTISAEDYYKQNIVHALERRGITVGGACAAPAEREELLFRIEGIPVSEYVYRMFTDSDNARAELLFLNLGYSLRGRATYENGAAACTALLNQRALAPDACSIADGSGLSRCNTVSAQVLVKLLRFMNGDKNREFFINSLAISGLTGTLKHKFSAPELTGRVRAKSGTLDDVVTLSGFADTARGGAVFSFLANRVDDKKKIWKLYEEMLLCLINR